MRPVRFSADLQSLMHDNIDCPAGPEWETLCAESNRPVDSIEYSSHQATPKDPLHVRKSLLSSET